MATSIEKDHELGIRVVCEHLLKAGATVQAVNTSLSQHPQVIATIDGVLHFIAVVTERHPAEPRLLPQMRKRLMEDANRHGAIVKFAPVGLWSTGTRNNAGDEGFYVRYAGLKDLEAEQCPTDARPDVLTITVRGGTLRMPLLRDTRLGQPRPATIAYSKDADSSTGIRLMAHHWFEMMARVAHEPDAPRPLRDDFETTLRFLEVPDYDSIGSLQREKWEAAVVSFLAYEGPQASNDAEADLFRGVREMIAKGPEIPRISLTVAIRGVLSRMLVFP